MEGETIKGIVELLASGGNAAALFIVYLVWRGIEHLRKAAVNIELIAKSVEALPEIKKDVHEVVDKIEQVDNRIATQELKLTAALAARRSQ